MLTARTVLFVFCSFGAARGLDGGHDGFAAACAASIVAFNADPSFYPGDGRGSSTTAHSLLFSFALHFHSPKAVIRRPDQSLVRDGHSFLFVHSSRPLLPLVCRMPLGFLREALQIASNFSTEVNPTELSAADEFLAQVRFENGSRPAALEWSCPERCVCCGTDCCPLDYAPVWKGIEVKPTLARSRSLQQARTSSKPMEECSPLNSQWYSTEPIDCLIDVQKALVYLYSSATKNTFTDVS
ncbi:hypothetical protein M3Y99_00670600 [Aphelenchoides fujianensis]|nr:hypothetical protein M3Y99_00670600 [Aphelenchoides fujianensis]